MPHDLASLRPGFSPTATSSRPSIVMKLVLSATALALFTAMASAAEPRVIEEAERYTVKISSSVEYPFGNEYKGSSRGAGFLIDKERGWILTNAHVAKRSPSTVRVNFKNGAQIRASKVHVDDHLDLAVLRIDPAAIPETARIADYECAVDAAPGRPVIAYGHPWSLDFTATRGIVSGTKAMSGTEKLQTDAAINPGNSGGPLIDERSGKIIGINASTLMKSSAEGLSFAVPMHLVCTIIDLLRAGKDPSPPKLAAEFGTTLRDRELVVGEVGELWRGRLNIGDRILSVDGDERVRFASRLIDRMRGKTEVKVLVQRAGKKVETTLPVPAEKSVVVREGVHVSGMSLAPSTVPGSDASIMVVHFIDDASVADQSEFREGDRVVAIDGKPIRSLQEAAEALAGKDGDEVEFVLRRERSRGSRLYDVVARRLDVDEAVFIDAKGRRPLKGAE